MILTNLLNSGNVYIAEQWSNRIRKVTVSTSNITTIAGTGAANYSGDGGVATSAALNYPTGVAADMEGFTFFLYFLLSCFDCILTHVQYREYLYRRLWESSYPQGDGINGYHIHNRWYRCC